MSHSKLQVNTVPHLGVFEYLSIIGSVLRIGPALLSAFLFGPREQPTKVRLRNALILHMTSSLSHRQIQGTTPPARDTYVAWMKKKKLEPVITELPGDGMEKAATRLLWVGPKWDKEKDADGRKKVFLYMHGGGFVIPMNKEYLPLMEHYRKSYKERNPEGELSVALLEYTVTPNQKYPHQLSQAANALSHLLSLGIPPSSIILGGDSCGGHLALSLVSHILHPHPTLPTIRLSTPFNALLLVSPAVTFNTTSASYRRNARHDYQSASFVSWYGSLFTSSSSYDSDVAAGNYWGEPLSAPEEWWRGLEEVVKKVAITAGEWEVFVDDVVKFGEGLKGLEAVRRGLVDIEVRVGRKEAHDEPLMKFGDFDDAGKGETMEMAVKLIAGRE